MSGITKIKKTAPLSKIDNVTKVYATAVTPETISAAGATIFTATFAQQTAGTVVFIGKSPAVADTDANDTTTADFVQLGKGSAIAADKTSTCSINIPANWNNFSLAAYVVPNTSIVPDGSNIIEL